MAAAFNAPLAGVIFAIEELGRDVMLRWERQIFIGILAAGFAQVAIMGNHPYFSNFYAYGTGVKHLWLWVLAVALVCGVMGGLFSRLLFKGVGWVIPSAGWKAWVQRRPILLAGLMGLLLAAVGTISGRGFLWHGRGASVGSVHNQYHAPFGMSLWKWLATIFSYWAGIPGGIFTPCLTIGAMIGHDLAQLAGLGLGGNVLVLLGMVAFLSGGDAIAADGERGGDGDDGQPAAAGVDADGGLGGDGGVAAVFAQAVLSCGGGAVSAAGGGGV